MPPSLATDLGFKPKNKVKRQSAYLKVKKARESLKRDERHRRRREEDRNPRLRVERRARNIPASIDRKRVWDDVDIDDGDGDGLGLSVDVERLKRRKPSELSPRNEDGLTESNLRKVEAHDGEADGFRLSGGDGDSADSGSEDDDLASIIGEESEDEADTAVNLQEPSLPKNSMPPPPQPERASSPTPSSASTNLSFIPDALASKFPTLFKPPETPKILITTDLNGTVHDEAELLTDLFPNSNYVPRTRHRYNAHRFSLREISKFASNRDYTAIVVLNEDLKRPSGMTVIHLPEGPTFHFSITNWVEGKKLPGHGKPTEHYPELILNNFRTPLGLLAASLFRTMFPPQPEIEGRQVVTLHNQRDYIFVRRHRYIFRNRKATEKRVTEADGKFVKGVEEIKAGLQELGPRFTLKLRRVDKGIQRASGSEWEWKAKMDKQRTKFQL